MNKINRSMNTWKQSDSCQMREKGSGAGTGAVGERRWRDWPKNIHAKTIVWWWPEGRGASRAGWGQGGEGTSITVSTITIMKTNEINSKVFRYSAQKGGCGSDKQTKPNYNNIKWKQQLSKCRLKSTGYPQRLNHERHLYGASNKQQNTVSTEACCVWRRLRIWKQARYIALRICHEKETRNVSFQDKDTLLSGLERRLLVKGKDPEEKAPFWVSISNSLERGIYCSLKENISSMLELSK